MQEDGGKKVQRKGETEELHPRRPGMEEDERSAQEIGTREVGTELGRIVLRNRKPAERSLSA